MGIGGDNCNAIVSAENRVQSAEEDSELRIARKNAKQQKLATEDTE